MKGTKPLNNDESHNLGLEGGLKNRWQYDLLIHLYLRRLKFIRINTIVFH